MGPMKPALPLLLLLTVSLASSAGEPFASQFNFGQHQPDSDRSWLNGNDGGFNFIDAFHSFKSDSRRSRSEETKQEVLTHSQNSEWTRGFQDNGRGGLQSLDSSSSEEKTAGRSAKELKASESGESAQREQRLTQVNGKTVTSADSGKQSSFSNSGQVANRTEFSSETSSGDKRLAKAAQPPPPPPPQPPLVACLRRTRASLVILVHATADAEVFARALGFLETFLNRLAPARAVLVFFNRRVLDVVDFPLEGDSEALRRRLADAARSLRGVLAEDFDIPAATTAAERLRRQLRLAAPCALVLLAPVGVRADDRALMEARPAADDARRSFDQLTTVFGGRELEPRAADLLSLFSTGGRPGLLPIELGGGDLGDAQAADALGRRVCDAADSAGPGRFEEPGPRPEPGWKGR